MSALSEDAIPDADPSSTAGLLAERLQAWKHAVGYMEEYMGAVEKIHKEQAKEYEKVLKTISKPLREGHHFDQSLGGIAGFFENMRSNTQALINTNIETEKNIKGSVLPILERLHKEIKHKAKELAHGAQKGAKEVDKARNTTQKHIELLGQQTASFESTGGKMAPHDDPYVVHKGVINRLHKQIMEENNHRNDLIAVQNNFETFEAHVVEVLQQAMEAFNQFAGGQAERVRALYSDMLGCVQRIPPDFEWKGFASRRADILVNPSDPPRTVDAVQFPNMNHQSTKPLIEGSLERKSRNKLSWGYSTGYYVVTPSRFLHGFKDSDVLRGDPTPELSIYLPDATVGSPNGDKFTVKGKDRSKSISSKLVGGSELSFKAHTMADADRWFAVIREVAGANGPARVEETPASPLATTSAEADALKTEGGIVATPPAEHHKEQEAGITGGHAVTSPTEMSPVAATTKGEQELAASTAEKKTTQPAA
ncbi:uncharacterized protein E0L32_001417 [Thyridium curvatum]|uniref:PH domain-containing protein n=1 Tax=Thyridium curvatum TaxID=1093900 RepID=A0A507B0Z6_9PEZI|nr:uncharacterized protein E0L32_001417 [Thyridium curvatum]TPX10220.1 hypothetical protein E0L32_001417 [Thyridium curvatum]